MKELPLVSGDCDNARSAYGGEERKNRLTYTLKRMQLFIYGKRITSVVPEGNASKRFFFTFAY